LRRIFAEIRLRAVGAVSPPGALQFLPKRRGPPASPEKIQFAALEASRSKPTHLVFLFLVPAGGFQQPVRALANVATLLHRQDFRDGWSDRFL
jgi:hypothetical protein